MRLNARIFALYATGRRALAGLTALMLFLSLVPYAQAANSPSPQDTEYAVVERGADYNIWQKTNYITGPDGQVESRVHKYTELGTGLNFVNSQGQFVASQEIILPQTNGGAAALFGSHQVYFPYDIAEGVIETVASDGVHLKSQPAAVYYYDGVSNVLLGRVQM
jgi:hypothetical protein